MEIIEKDIKDLIPYENNPRINDEAVQYVAESIKQFGFKVPMVIDKNNVIVAGHTRYKASEMLGLTKIPCIIADDLTEEQIKAYRLADNKVAENSKWDIDKLDEELANIVDIDMTDLGFDLDLELDSEEKDIIEDEVPEVDEEKEPVAKLGDIYQLGNHRLMCGDSTKKDDVMRLMNKQEADMILTDPPYNVNYGGKTADTLKMKNDNMNEKDFYNFLLDSFKNMFEISKCGCSIYIFHADTEGLNFRKAFKNAGFKLSECLIWVKNTFVLGRQDYQWRHEPILYGWKEGAGHYFIDDRKQSTVLEFDKSRKNAEHPTMKPIDLLVYLIKNSSRENDLILDLFGGSGSTLIACEQFNRNCYMMELDPRYVDVIIQRWENLTGEKAIKLN